jgi:hypothetical protein
MRSLTDCGGAGVAVAVCVEAGVAFGFIERKAGWCFLGMLLNRARGLVVVGRAQDSLYVGGGWGGGWRCTRGEQDAMSQDRV